jgi:hypothetical protein
MIKSRRVGWVGHTERLGDTRYSYKVFLSEILKGIDYVDDIVVDCK